MKRYGGLATILVVALVMVAIIAETAFSMAEVKTHKITDHIYRLECVDFGSVNVTVYEGRSGLVVVDAGYFSTREELRKAILEIGNGEVLLLIQTHAHGDHVGGSKSICGDANIVAHHAAAERLNNEYGFLGGESPIEMPNITLVDSLVFDFEGEEIRLLHLPRAHTAGDIIVHFVGSNLLCAGDLLFNGKLPFVHASRGGTVEGYLGGLAEIEKIFPPGIVIVPGHGDIMDMAGLVDYRDEMTKMVYAVETEIDNGMSLEQLVASEVLAPWKELSDPVYTTDTTLIGILHQNKVYAGEPPEPIADVMLPVILDDGIEAAVELYHELKGNEADRYDFGEAELNSLGYNMMARKRLDHAAILFKLNTEVYPASANVYDSMGEICMVRGDVELAVKNYEKSLSLNPDNRNAAQMLEKLKQAP